MVVALTDHNDDMYKRCIIDTDAPLERTYIEERRCETELRVGEVRFGDFGYLLLCFFGPLVLCFLASLFLQSHKASVSHQVEHRTEGSEGEV